LFEAPIALASLILAKSYNDHLKISTHAYCDKRGLRLVVPMSVVRDPQIPDEDDWRRLWSGYNAFYQVQIPEAVTAAT
jgi:hypothetical protein